MYVSIIYYDLSENEVVITYTESINIAPDKSWFSKYLIIWPFKIIIIEIVLNSIKQGEFLIHHECC